MINLILKIPTVITNFWIYSYINLCIIVRDTVSVLVNMGRLNVLYIIDMYSIHVMSCVVDNSQWLIVHYMYVHQLNVQITYCIIVIHVILEIVENFA